MTNIQFLKNRIIIDGHADTKQECETITLLCDNLAKSKDFKTVRYESGYAEFVKVGKAEELKFVSTPPTDVNCVIEFDSGITSVSCENGSSTVTWTTSNSSQSLTVAGKLSTEITFTPIFKSGYELESVTAIVDKETIYAVTIASDKKSFSVDVEQRDFTLTITTKQSGSSTSNTWVINKTGIQNNSLGKQTINFKSNNKEYIAIDNMNDSSSLNYYYDNTEYDAPYYDAGPQGFMWEDEKYRTIEFKTTPTGDLLQWLNTNATQATPTTKQQIDLSTLSGWANLSSGNHNITIKAKGAYYMDSPYSNSVVVRKGSANNYTVSYTNKGTSQAPCKIKINGGEWVTITESSGSFQNVEKIQFYLTLADSYACTVKSTQLGLNLSANSVITTNEYAIQENVTDIIIGWEPEMTGI